MEQFEAKMALSALYSKNEVKTHSEKKDFKNVWKVTLFFAFFYDAFVVHLLLLT